MSEMPKSPHGSDPRVFVVLPVFQANENFFREQIASLEAQQCSGLFVVCVNADRASGAFIEAVFTDYELAYHCIEPSQNLDSYRAFELGLSEAFSMSIEGDVFALCDQDDIWREDRLRLSVEELQTRKVDMVHSDARVVDQHGRVQHRSIHRLEARVRAPDLRCLLLRNTVTGMTATLTRDLVEAALPFPSQSAVFFHHDLWLALVAKALRGLTCIDDALVDYRQHGHNAVGALERSAERPRFGGALWRRQRAGDYFVAAYLAKTLYLRMTEIASTKERVINHKELAKLSPYLAERGGSSKFFVDALFWTVRMHPHHAIQAACFGALRLSRLGWALRKTIERAFMPALEEFDSKGFSRAPGVVPRPEPRQPLNPKKQKRLHVSALIDERQSPRFSVQVDRTHERSVSVLLPTLNPTEIFAGVATAIDFGLNLARHGHRVRFIACDLPVAAHGVSQRFISDRAAQMGDHSQPKARIETVCGVTQNTVRFHPDDRILACAWWSAHVARKIIEHGGFSHERFLYLIQDFEPNFYAWGDEAAAALATYDFDHIPIFNTVLLRDFFMGSGIGRASRSSFAFQPSIDVDKYASLARTGSIRKRFLVYGRPEVPRNLFATGLLALDKFLLRQRISPSQIDITSVGLVHPDVELSNGSRVTSVGKVPWDEYPSFLAQADIGLALMFSPHPSHLPLEMAAAGARVVTNGFLGKDLSKLSGAIISVSPSVEAVCDGLVAAFKAPQVSASERQVDLNKLGVPLAQCASDVSRFLRSEASGQIVEISTNLGAG